MHGPASQEPIVSCDFLLQIPWAGPTNAVRHKLHPVPLSLSCQVNSRSPTASVEDLLMNYKQVKVHEESILVPNTIGEPTGFGNPRGLRPSSTFVVQKNKNHPPC